MLQCYQNPLGPARGTGVFQGLRLAVRRSVEVMSQRCLQIHDQFLWREGRTWLVRNQLQAVGMQDRSDHPIAQALTTLPFDVPHL